MPPLHSIPIDPAEAFDRATHDAYNERLRESHNPDWTDAKFEEETVVLRVPREAAERLRPYGCAPGPGCSTCNQQAELGRLLYMDVGRWGGGAPSARTTSSSWGRNRFFGLVCGQVALLCNYPTPGAPGTADRSKVPTSVYHHSDYRLIEPLLEHLSSDGDLGSLRIEQALALDMPTVQASTPAVTAEACTSGRIDVFLGDLHLPVMDTSLQAPHDTLFGNAYAPPRKGRVDAFAMDLIVKHAASMGVLWPISPTVLGRILLDLKGQLGGTTELLPADWDSATLSSATLSLESALRWFEFYSGYPRTSTDPSNKRLGAEIFENADFDLRSWAELLASYQETAAWDSEQPPVRLVQMGDCYDFWIGLQLLHDGPIWEASDSYQSRFVDFWVEQTGRTRAGHALRRLRELATDSNAKRRINAIFLRGNHDNYLRLSTAVQTERWYEMPGLFAEHGHAIDPFNSDATYAEGWRLRDPLILCMRSMSTRDRFG